ncbi:hypothetical protein [Paracoccus tibetensis]|uniref:Uncharacterized protein n=1 Tax=Paracoccus tibetensis TaxID=336292 RepID=A0A1G5K753_9RHOB|nr:hypothetical protein [Paracoccus tibetensis]SCY96426.1 hypothetical protein SAMN05660710_03736 [Paracoccus tibetensis]
MFIKALATLLALVPLAAHAEGPDPLDPRIASSNTTQIITLPASTVHVGADLARSNLARNDLVRVTLVGTDAATPDRSSREDQ